MSSNHHRRLAMLLAVLTGLACATYRKSRPDLPKDERGMAELSQLLRDMRRAIPAGELEQAGAMADELEDGIASADTVTASHPDFADLVAASRRARAVYEETRRKHEAGELMAAMQPMMIEGDRLLERLTESGPTEETLDDLEEIIEELGELRTEGEEYVDVDRYYEFSLIMEDRFAAFVTEEHRSRWALGAQNELEEVLRHVATDDGRDRGFASRIERAEQNAKAYGRCSEVVDAVCARDGFSPQLPVKTRLGLLTAPAVGALCAAHRDDARQRADGLRWHRDIAVVAARANAAMEEIDRGGKAPARLRASERALVAMTECVSGLAAAEERVGYDPKVRLRSWAGRVSVTALRASCTEQADRLRGQMPILNWRATFARLRDRVAEADRDRATARGETNPEQRQLRLSAALGGFEECDERVAFLAKRKDAALAGADPSKAEWLALEALRKSCVKHAGRVRKQLERAEAAVVRKEARARKKKRR